jgi:hypothetical protein
MNISNLKSASSQMVVIRPLRSQQSNVYQTATNNPLCTGNRPVAHTPIVLDEVKCIPQVTRQLN